MKAFEVRSAGLRGVAEIAFWVSFFKVSSRLICSDDRRGFCIACDLVSKKSLVHLEVVEKAALRLLAVVARLQAVSLDCCAELI